MQSKKSGSSRVDLTRKLELLRQHMTAALCQAAFQKVRTTEQQRCWSLFALVSFWTAVVLRAPVSLRHALGGDVLNDT